MIAALIFYMFAAIGILSAVMVVSSRNPVHSVLFLVLTFFNGAGLFLLLGAEFLAMMLVVVYVGAVAVLFLFVVMMLDIDTLKLREGFMQYLPLGTVIGLVLFLELAVIFGGWVFAADVQALVASPMPAAAEMSNTAALGRVLYTKYAYLFQASGLILLVAMIGSILLTLRKRAGVRKQNIPNQIARKSSLEMRKVPTGGGI